MIKIALFVLFAFGATAAAAAADQPAAPAPAIKAPPALEADRCKGSDASEVVVCGRSPQRYRIDPAVLAATRSAEAKPAKPPITGDVPEAGCAGPNCGGGSYVPLIGMALTALKAAELAADGDDWREAFRTKPDQYQAYSRAKAKKGGISIGVSAGNK